MRKNLKLQAIVGAALLVVAGAMIVAAEEIRLEVLKTDGAEVVVDVNDASTAVQLDDLADGEERSFSAGEHTVVVRRSGDELIVKLDGVEIGDPDGLHEEGDETHFMWAGEGDDEAVIKTVVVRGVGASGGRARVVCLGGGDGSKGDLDHRLSTLGIDLRQLKDLETVDLEGHDCLRVGADEGKVGPRVLKSHRCLSPDRVRFRCAEDGAVLMLTKGDATQERYLCPVCGRAMEKAEHATIRIKTMVKTDEDCDPVE